MLLMDRASLCRAFWPLRWRQVVTARLQRLQWPWGWPIALMRESPLSELLERFGGFPRFSPGMSRCPDRYGKYREVEAALVTLRRVPAQRRPGGRLQQSRNDGLADG
jgi:hypothetical protein